jgi:hypothetical protein
MDYRQATARNHGGQWWNNKSYHVKWRERTTWVTDAQRTNRDGYTTHHKRRVTRWTSWQPFQMVYSATAAMRYAEHYRKANGLRDVAVFFDGKRIDDAVLKRRASEEFRCCSGSDEPLHAHDSPTVHCADCPEGKRGPRP